MNVKLQYWRQRYSAIIRKPVFGIRNYWMLPIRFEREGTRKDEESGSGEISGEGIEKYEFR